MDPRKEVIEKFTALVWREPFHGDWRKMFLHFSNGSEDLNRRGLEAALIAAGFDEDWRLNLYVAGVFKVLDTNRDKVLSWMEFQAKFRPPEE